MASALQLDLSRMLRATARNEDPMIRKLSSLLGLASILLAGCQAGTQERVFLRYEAGKAPVVAKATYNGTYRLYGDGSKTPTTQMATPIYSLNLKRRDLIGFANDGAGQLVAVVR